MVETTNWEERNAKAQPIEPPVAAEKATSQSRGWLHSWKEREMSHDGQYRER